MTMLPGVIELTITALSHAGEGIGRDAGRAVFVPFALPGETVRAEITSEKKNFARARLLEVLTPSPERISPPCPHHFSLSQPPSALACGGCQLQHLDYAAQLRFKQQTVVEQFNRVGGFTDPPVRALLPAPSPFRYRNHVQFSLTPEGRLGFQAAGSNRVVAVRECHLLSPAVNALWAQLAIESAPDLERLTLRATDEDALVIFESEADAPDLELDVPVSAALLRPTGSSYTLAGRNYLVETVRGRAFKISAGSFFQVNTALAEQMVALVLEALALRGGETVLDVYCGVGLFTSFIAPLAGRVIGIEAYAPAVGDAAENLDEFDNVEIYEAPAEEVLPALKVKADVVVLDPPRAGCAPAVLEALASSGAARIVYISCDPATLARDAKRLCAQEYALRWVQPLDMFPQTYHVECVALFEKPAV
jgi:23S rRNA (uracil1939-C5)-methyltransferase